MTEGERSSTPSHRSVGSCTCWREERSQLRVSKHDLKQMWGWTFEKKRGGAPAPPPMGQLAAAPASRNSSQGWGRKRKN